MKLLRYFLAIIFILILKSCANQQAPTGGPKDETEPKVKSTTPPQNTINFKGDKITINFDEAIQLASSSESFFIIPTTKNPPHITSTKKSVTISFNEQLKENTTYTLYFNKAIKDVTEGNDVDQLTYTFSTGPYIDSLNIKGNTKDLWKNKPEKDILVGLYDANDTSTISNAVPAYYSYTNEQGNFELKYIKEGTYNIFALKDENRNMKYDQEKETIGFLKNLNLKKDTTGVNLLMSRIDTTGPRIKETTNAPGKYIITFTEGLVDVTIDNNTILYKQDDKKSKLELYDPRSINDSISIKITARDSLNNTSVIDHKFTFKPLKKGEKYLPLLASIAPAEIINPYKPELKMEFNYPVKEVREPLKYSVAGKTIQPKETWNESKTRFTIQPTVNQGDTLQIIIPDSTFISVYQISNTADTIRTKVNQESEYGTVEGKVLHDNMNFQVQLVNSGTFEVVQVINNKTDFQFTGVTPGEYFIRIVWDVNKNGFWDQQSIEENIKAEPVMFHKELIKVKANWEIKGIELRL
jgi:uncharacterized protein (DUF2141 family)